MFQSLFLWMTLVGQSHPDALVIIFDVSILVLVDDARGHFEAAYDELLSRVSILVLVDDARGQRYSPAQLAGLTGFQSLFLWMTLVGR